jgi:hypothetical protein
LQGEKDDKIIAVCADDPEYRHYKHIKELPPHRLAEIRRFFEDCIHITVPAVLVTLSFFVPSKFRCVQEGYMKMHKQIILAPKALQKVSLKYANADQIHSKTAYLLMMPGQNCKTENKICCILTISADKKNENKEVAVNDFLGAESAIEAIGHSM